MSRHETEADIFVMNKKKRLHPFQDLYKVPKAIPLLYDQLSQTFSNNWNEFLSAYDPLENPSVLKNPSKFKKIKQAALFSEFILPKNLMSSRKV